MTSRNSCEHVCLCPVRSAVPHVHAAWQLAQVGVVRNAEPPEAVALVLPIIVDLACCMMLLREVDGALASISFEHSLLSYHRRMSGSR